MYAPYHLSEWQVPLCGTALLFRKSNVAKIRRYLSLFSLKSIIRKDRIMRKLFVIVVLFSFLMGSCTDNSSNDISKLESEVKRLAEENYTLRKEPTEIKENSAEYENIINNLETNLELALQNQKERHEESYNFKNDVIKKLAMTHKTNELIQYTAFKENIYSNDIYGKALYEEMRHTGVKEFIEILKEKELAVIDDVTNLLIEYVNKNNQIDEFIHSFIK